MMEFHLQKSIYHKTMERQTSTSTLPQKYYRVCVPILATLFSVFVIICSSIFLSDTISLIKQGSHSENFPGVVTLSVFTSTACVSLVIAVFQLAANVFCIRDFEEKIHTWCIIHMTCALSLAGSTSFSYAYRADILATGQLFLFNCFVSSMSSITLVIFLYLNWL